MKHKRQIKGPFVAIPKAIMETPAWRTMHPGARLLWIDLRGRLRNDGLNNGQVFRSCRDSALAIGTKSKSSIVRWYTENEHYGFLRKTSEGFLGSDGRGIAAHYRFTDLAHGTHPPTRDFEKWSGELFLYAPRRGRRKKQNPVPTMGTPRTHHGYIRTTENGGAVCTHHGDIGEPARCTHHGDISRLPSPAAGGEQIQGSLTVRAPAKAGGAGSSPAPVASSTETSPSRSEEVPAPAPTPPPPWVPYSQRDIDHERHSREGLMAHVADVIEKQLSNPEEAREAKQGMSATNGNGADRRGSISANKAHRLFRQHVKHEKAWGQGPADMSLRCRIKELGVPRERVEIEFRRIKRLAREAPARPPASTRPTGVIASTTSSEP